MTRLFKHNSLILLPIIAFSMIAIGVVSCTKLCGDLQSTIPKAAFFNSETKQSITLPDFTFYGIGVPNDSMLINNASAQQVVMPFRINSDETSFVFQYNAINSPNDTITVKYDAVPYLASEECGSMYAFDIKEYTCTHNTIDSIKFLTNHFDNTDGVRIQIFFHL